MTFRRAALILIPLALGTAGATLPTSAAFAEAPTNGCPSGFVLFAVGTPGYRVPSIVDSPNNTYGFGHQPGNGDGWVCARRVGKSDNGGVLYEFFDNTLPAAQ